MEQKHSGLGIGAFVISVVVGILMFLLIVIAGVAEASSPGSMDTESPGAVLVGLGMIGLMGIDFVALGLGVAALFQSGRRKVLAILGVVFSVATILGTVMLSILGLFM